MEIWRGYRKSLEELYERNQGKLTSGQAKGLTELIGKIQIAELAGKPPGIKAVSRLANGLLIGQHLEADELVKFARFLNPVKKRR